MKTNSGAAIQLAAGHSLEQLLEGLDEFIASVNQQIEEESPEAQALARQNASNSVGKMMTEKEGDALAVRDRIAEVYFAYLARAERIRKAVQQAEVMARHDEKFAEIIRGSIEAWFLCSWNAKKITGHYREFRLSKNPDKIQILDEKLIPEEFWDTPEPSKVLNKTRLKTALEAGVNVPGVVFETNRTRLDIK